MTQNPDLADHWRMLVEWRLYADRSRFPEAPKERFFVIQGVIRRRQGKVFGAKIGTCSLRLATSTRPGHLFRDRESS